MAEKHVHLHIEPLLVRDADAAALLGMSPSYFQRFWNSADFGPRPHRFGRADRGKFWRVSDLRRWVDAGLPTRKQWLSMPHPQPSEKCGDGCNECKHGTSSISRSGDGNQS